MTATPTLSKTQQKKATSAKKSLAKGLKNVLVQPDDNHWPLLQGDYASDLESILRSILPKKVHKSSKTKIPWSELRSMNKEERKAAKNASDVIQNEKYDETIANCILTGVNCTTKGLERNNVCCILIDSTIDPKILAKHLIIMATNKNIPILLIPFLKTVTLETLGYASAAISLRNEVKSLLPNTDLYMLYKKLLEYSDELKKLQKSDVTFQDTSLGKEATCDEVEISQPMEIDSKDKVESSIISTDTYLYRKSTNERIFQPPASHEFKDVSSSTNIGADFIALDTDKYTVDNKKMPSRFFEKVSSSSNEDNKKKVQNKVSYKPLKVKRLKGNENRLKATKLKKIKKKKQV